MPVMSARLVMAPFYAVEHPAVCQLGWRAGDFLAATHPCAVNHPAPHAPSHVGARIAALRVAHRYTQQELAARIAISRVALSNLESGRSVPGERTVTLLAGIFGMEPYDLVEGTTYPTAKVDRLPLVAARHTEVELQLRLLDRDLRWLESAPPAVAERVVQDWRRELRSLREATLDLRQQALVDEALERL
jgi:transcriptional regulator with XRE-family HTH domain